MTNMFLPMHMDEVVYKEVLKKCEKTPQWQGCRYSSHRLGNAKLDWPNGERIDTCITN